MRGAEGVRIGNEIAIRPGGLRSFTKDKGERCHVTTFVIVLLRSTKQWKWIPGSAARGRQLSFTKANNNRLSGDKNA